MVYSHFRGIFFGGETSLLASRKYMFFQPSKKYFNIDRYNTIDKVMLYNTIDKVMLKLDVRGRYFEYWFL